jgi:hypothetical protein
VCQNHFHNFSVCNVDVRTIKYVNKCIWVTSPSIRSKLLQKLLYGFSPKIVERVNTARRPVRAARIGPFFGLYVGTLTASTTQRKNKISMRTRNAKPLPVINGKNISRATISGINGTKNSPAKRTFLRISIDFIHKYYNS